MPLDHRTPSAPPASPARRRFATGVGTALVAVPWPAQARAADGRLDGPFAFEDLQQAERALPRLGAEPLPRDGGGFAWAPMLVHCAQSIEFSMSGFPEPRSALFQATAGRVAFRVFALRGRMSHDLTAPIPGAPALDPAVEAAAAMARLQAAIGAFRSWTGPLAPHFAYGALDRADYERAHAMHLAEHLSAFRAAG